MPIKKHLPADYGYEFDSPFLAEELFEREWKEECKPRASALASESPLQSAFERGRVPGVEPEVDGEKTEEYRFPYEEALELYLEEEPPYDGRGESEESESVRDDLPAFELEQEAEDLPKAWEEGGEKGRARGESEDEEESFEMPACELETWLEEQEWEEPSARHTRFEPEIALAEDLERIEPTPDAFEFRGNDRPGHAIPRAKVQDQLGNRILDLLWEPVDENDAVRVVSRFNRLRALFDAVPSGVAACRLLERLEPGGDLQRDFDYRLMMSTRSQLRDSLRARCQRSVPKPPEPVPDRDDKPSTPILPTPLPPSPSPTEPIRKWQAVGEYVFSSKPRRLRRFKRWGLFYYLEAKVTASVNATDQELVAIKARWKNGKYKPEIELRLVDQLGFDLQVEKDKGKLALKFKRDIVLPGDLLEITPTLQLSLTEPLKIYIGSVPKLSFSLTFKGWQFRIDVKPKVVLTVRIDWVSIIKDEIKDTIGDLWEDLADFFGRKIIGSRLRQILMVLAGLVLAKLLLDRDKPLPPRDRPLPPPDPGDVSGHDGALELARGTTANAARLLKEAEAYRKSFAIALGDTLAELTEPSWLTSLDGLTTNPRSVLAFKGLPRRGPIDTKTWEYWAPSTGQTVQEKVRLNDDNFVARFRLNETAMMFALAAFLVGKLRKDDLDIARGTAHQQAAAAGMAAAVIHVRSMIRRETYEFLDETGKLQKRSGIDAWNSIAGMARKAVPDKMARQRRLAGLATDILPRL